MKHTISADRRTLTITVDEPERLALVEALDEEHNPDSNEVMHEVFWRLLANSDLSWVDPSDWGDLTDAPMLGIRDHDDDEVLERWAYMSYQIKSPVAELAETGKVVFTS